jgi:hypothetical protein
MGKRIVTEPTVSKPETPKHRPQNRGTSASKLRRDRKHCPVCLSPLPKNTARTRLRKSCVSCQAHPSRGKACRKCGARAVWENKRGAACQACGAHGTKERVIAGFSG